MKHFTLIKTTLMLCLMMVGLSAWGETLTVDFESETSAYTDWTFTNFTTKQTDTNVTAHGGSYFGTTGGKTTGSLQTKEKIVAPSSLVCYVSKASNNTTSSSWKVQVSSNGTSWTDVKSQSATSMTRGNWTEFTTDLSSYSNVYVRIYYDGTTALRCIDDVTLTYSNSAGPAKTLTSIAISGTPNKVIYKDGDTFDPTGLVVTGTYSDGNNGNLTAQASFNCTPSAMTLGTTSVSVTATVSNISSATYNVSVTVNPNIDYVTLPWEWTGGVKADLTAIDGVTGYGLGSDYAASNAPYRVKFDGDGDYIQVKTNEPIGVCTIKVKVFEACTSSKIIVKGSTNGTNFTTVEELTISADANDTPEISTSGNLGSTYRYVRFEFKKQVNVGVGGISIAKAVAAKEVSNISVTGTPATFWKGDTFNHNGMTVTATYTDDTNEDVTSTAVFSGYDMATAGNQTVTVNYGGKTDTYNITVQTIANTQATAYTTTQAKALIDAGKDLGTEVYVKGIISQVDKLGTSGGITYWISEDGTTNDFEMYYCMNIAGEKFDDVDDVEVGASIVAYGPITYYSKGSVYEMNAGELVSYTAPTSTDITITAAGWTTFFDSKHAYTMPDDCEGYVFTADEGLELAYEAEEVVPAGEPLVIHTIEPGKKTLEYTTSAEDTYKSGDMNDLDGTDEATTLDADDAYYFYGLSKGKEDSENAGKVGFYWMNATGAAFRNGAHKAYLKLAKTAAPGAKSYVFDLFNDDTEDAIKAIDASSTEQVYDLAGRRVSKATKGIFIVNGKKVIR